MGATSRFNDKSAETVAVKKKKQLWKAVKKEIQGFKHPLFYCLRITRLKSSFWTTETV
jgi:hypothetical protein